MVDDSDAPSDPAALADDADAASDGVYIAATATQSVEGGKRRSSTCVPLLFSRDGTPPLCELPCRQGETDRSRQTHVTRRRMQR